ncbi:autotransporter outer membrane beta-barrel domain-containing protein [Pantoea deleyi]|uniref:autotransporter outer membrane beta-barrel domain-containing protein n=1 Tax=Pantoea deleyi TaxID=470932 RepID=UPI0035D47E5A
MAIFSYKKSALSLGITSFIIGLTPAAWGQDYSDAEIVSGTTYRDAELSLTQLPAVSRLTLTGESSLYVQNDGLVTDSLVTDNSRISLLRSEDESLRVHPGIRNTTVTGSGELSMGTAAVSTGQLFIGPQAALNIDSTDVYTTDVTVNSPAPGTGVYIENLTLAGTMEIGPAWIDDGDDGDAPLPDNIGPALVTRIDNLVMQPGSEVSMLAYTSGAQFNQLALKNLSGEGDFYLTSSLADGASDRITVSDKATGRFGIYVSDSGREITQPRDVQLVYINSGDARFSLLNRGGIVEAGVWQYRLDNKTENGHTEWFLVGGKAGESVSPEATALADVTRQVAVVKPQLSHSAQAVINLAAAPRVILDSETSSLRQRMGDLRRQNGDTGVWARYLSQNTRLDDNGYSAFHLSLNGMQIGADRQHTIGNGRILMGAFTSFSKSTVQSDHATNGNIRSYSGGLYTTWLDNSGYYADLLVKANHLNNDLATSMNSGSRVKGNYDQTSFTAAAETGYTLDLTGPFSVTPYGRFTYSRIGKASYALDNGMEASVNAANSIQGEVGTLLESKFDVMNHSVRPYLKVAAAREFTKRNRTEINEVAFDTRYSGNIGKYGAGFTADVARNASLYTEVTYQKGNKVETPVYATAGFRLSF